MMRPGCRSIDCSPVVLSSLNTGRKYRCPDAYTPRRLVTRLRERDRAEHRLGLGLRLLELASRVGVSDDPGPGLHYDAFRPHDRAAYRDRRVEVGRAPPAVSHGSRIGPPPLGLELVDDFHRAHLRRAGHGPGGEACLE